MIARCASDGSVPGSGCRVGPRSGALTGPRSGRGSALGSSLGLSNASAGTRMRTIPWFPVCRHHWCRRTSLRADDRLMPRAGTVRRMSSICHRRRRPFAPWSVPGTHHYRRRSEPGNGPPDADSVSRSGVLQVPRQVGQQAAGLPRGEEPIRAMSAKAATIAQTEAARVAVALVPCLTLRPGGSPACMAASQSGDRPHLAVGFGRHRLLC